MSMFMGQQSGLSPRASIRSDVDLLDNGPDAALDELTELAAVLSDADYAYFGRMSFNRLHFKSRYGFQASEQPAFSTACQRVIETGKSLLLQNASENPAFPVSGINLAGASPCLSYAGIPLFTSSGKLMGTLAVLAREPNRFCAEHLDFLKILGRQIVTRLELYSRNQAWEQEQRARQRAERALTVERHFVAATLDAIPSLLAVLDTAGRIVRFNSSCTRLTGLTANEATGRSFVDVVLEARDRAWATHVLADTASGQISGPHETIWRAASAPPQSSDATAADTATSAPPVPGVAARTRIVRWTLRPLKGSQGEVQYLIVTGLDITSQRQAEMASLLSEARYHEVVENSLGFVFTCSMDGRLTSFNASTAETLGYGTNELTGRSLSELLESSSVEAFQDCLEALRTQGEWQGALSLHCGEGCCRHLAIRGRRMEMPGGNLFILLHGIDVTEQHEAERALHLASHQREMILESVGEGIFGIDLDGRLTFINRAAAKALGYNPEEIVGHDLPEVIQHSDASGTLYSASTSPILEGMRHQETIRMRDELFWRQGGNPIPIEYCASPLLENDRVLGMVVIFQDVSERRRLEKMKDEFISSVGHELRTPLTSLRASLGLISSVAMDKRPEKRAQLIKMAIGNCDRLVRLVNDILDFDSMEKGKLSLNRQIIEAAVLLRRAADIAHYASSKERISFRIDAPPIKVFADEGRILKVLNELVTNAIKFSPPESLIRLSARLMTPEPNVAMAGGASEVCFIVEDQGRGIPAEKLESIFERFQQGDASDSRALGGTGLGLALCRSIIEQHDGRIWAESTPGEGSRFFFTLPAATNR
jgi:PAS domain S-box-containing protein